VRYAFNKISQKFNDLNLSPQRARAYSSQKRFSQDARALSQNSTAHKRDNPPFKIDDLESMIMFNEENPSVNKRLRFDGFNNNLGNS